MHLPDPQLSTKTASLYRTIQNRIARIPRSPKAYSRKNQASRRRIPTQTKKTTLNDHDYSLPPSPHVRLNHSPAPTSRAQYERGLQACSATRIGVSGRHPGPASCGTSNGRNASDASLSWYVQVRSLLGKCGHVGRSDSVLRGDATRRESLGPCLDAEAAPGRLCAGGACRYQNSIVRSWDLESWTCGAVRCCTRSVWSGFAGIQVWRCEIFLPWLGEGGLWFGGRDRTDAENRFTA